MNTIELLVQKGKLDQVFERLLQNARSRTLRGQVLNLQSEWNEIEKSQLLGILTYSDYTISLNRIRAAVIDLFNHTNMSSSSKYSEDYSSKITVSSSQIAQPHFR